jgi:hypothetical protein
VREAPGETGASWRQFVEGLTPGSEVRLPLEPGETPDGVWALLAATWAALRPVEGYLHRVPAGDGAVVVRVPGEPPPLAPPPEPKATGRPATGKTTIIRTVSVPTALVRRLEALRAADVPISLSQVATVAPGGRARPAPGGRPGRARNPGRPDPGRARNPVSQPLAPARGSVV